MVPACGQGRCRERYEVIIPMKSIGRYKPGFHSMSATIRRAEVGVCAYKRAAPLRLQLDYSSRGAVCAG